MGPHSRGEGNSCRGISLLDCLYHPVGQPGFGLAQDPGMEGNEQLVRCPNWPGTPDIPRQRLDRPPDAKLTLSSSPQWEITAARPTGRGGSRTGFSARRQGCHICIFHANVYENIFYQTMTSLSLGGSWFGHAKNSLRED